MGELLFIELGRVLVAERPNRRALVVGRPNGRALVVERPNIHALVVELGPKSHLGDLSYPFWGPEKRRIPLVS